MAHYQFITVYTNAGQRGQNYQCPDVFGDFESVEHFPETSQCVQVQQKSSNLLRVALLWCLSLQVDVKVKTML